MTAPLKDPAPPAFDPAFYRTLHPALALADDAEAAEHYEREGRSAGLVASPLALREGLVDFIADRGTVLEIGPFCRPLLTGSQVAYLDMLDSEGLRARARKLRIDPARCPDKIDYVGDLAQVDRNFDLVVSSHAIEHQPDLIRHLEQVARILERNGHYALVIPDRRYCFDHFLADSTIADVLAAYAERRRVHGLASVIEHEALVTHNDAARHWRGDHGRSPGPDRARRVLNAMRRHETSEGAYIDVHAWQFTPESFARMISDLEELGLCAFTVETVCDTPRDRQEFCALLRKQRSARRSPTPSDGLEIVMLQTADAFRYAPMLSITATANAEFCRRHRLRYEAFVGIKRGVWSWQATYNRIVQLKELLDGGFRGWGIYLDADAYVHDLDFDLAAYLAANDTFGAIFATSGVTGEQWDVNAGVAFVNFAHPKGRLLVERWAAAFDRLSDDRLRTERQWLHSDNDQDFLHQILMHDREIADAILVEPMDFLNSRHASFIRQHLRAQTEDLEARVRSIASEVQSILQRDNTPAALAAAATLPTPERERAQLLHPVRHQPRLAEQPVPPVSPDLARRAIDVWHTAEDHPTIAPHQRAFADMLERRDERTVAIELSQLGRAQIAQGFFGGLRQHQRCEADPLFAQHRAKRTFDALLSLAEMCGALSLESPDFGAWGRSADLPAETLFARIRQTVGHDLEPPSQLGGHLGIRVSRGLVLHIRMIEAIYAALRLRNWSTLLGTARIVELGGGAGLTGYYAACLGLGDYRIIDTPIMSAVQAFVNGGADDGKFIPSPSLGDLRGHGADILFSEDSLGDMDDDTALHLLRNARGNGIRAVLSFNAEAVANDRPPRRGIRDVAGDAGYRMLHRQRHGLRPGFAEELLVAEA